MHYQQVLVTRNETTSMEVLVGPWELPILEAIHGDERMAIGELRDYPRRPYPDDARSEMQRLSKLYGSTGAGDNSPTHAERVYGTGTAGVRALHEAIERAKAEAAALGKGGTETAAPAAPAVAPKRGRPARAAKAALAPDAEDLVGAPAA